MPANFSRFFLASVRRVGRGMVLRKRWLAAVGLLASGLAAGAVAAVLSPSEVKQALEALSFSDRPIARLQMLNEPAGGECSEVGMRLNLGWDINADGVLQSTEVSSTRLVCYQTGGPAPLMSMRAEPAGSHCPKGGTEVMAGLDLNGSGTLGANEVSVTAYVCEGDAKAKA